MEALKRFKDSVAGGKIIRDEKNYKNAGDVG